jgi:FkbM family methyltransferase
MTPDHIDERLRTMCEKARRFETTAPAKADAEPNERPIVLCGAGPLGQMTLAHLRQIGRQPLALIDNDPRRWGAALDGLPILKPADAVRMYADSACFVVTIYNGSSTRRQLSELGCAHVIHFADLFFRYPEEFLPFCGLARRSAMLDAWSEAVQAAHVWSDERSVLEYLAQLEWRLRLPGCRMPARDSAAECYFPSDLFSFLDEEMVFDCGAFDGDSIRQYLTRRPAQSQARIIAFEPDTATFSRLSDYRRKLPPDVGERIRIEPWAVADRSGEVRFSALGSVKSGIEATGTTTAVGIALDDLAIVPTFIKMDVEGFELPALRGATNILREHEPLLAISLYHHASDLWTIPNFIKRLVPGYRLFLRRYAEDCWESILYAVPVQRLIDAGSPSLSVPVKS